MARSQERDTTILLGLEGHEVGKVIEEEKGIGGQEVRADLKKPKFPHCGSAELYRGVRVKKRRLNF